MRIYIITAELVMHFNYFLIKLKHWCKSYAVTPERDIFILTNSTIKNTVLQFLSECANSPKGSLCKGVASVSWNFAVHGRGEKPLKGLKVKIKEQTNTGDFVTGICYRLPDQEEQVGGSLLPTTGSQALVLVGSFDLPISGGKARGLGAGNPGDFWNVADNFFAQVVDETARAGALLDLSLMNKEELIREMKAAGNLGCSVQKLVEFKILRGVQDKE